MKFSSFLYVVCLCRTLLITVFFCFDFVQTQMIIKIRFVPDSDEIERIVNYGGCVTAFWNVLERSGTFWNAAQ